MKPTVPRIPGLRGEDAHELVEEAGHLEHLDRIVLRHPGDEPIDHSIEGIAGPRPGQRVG